MSKCCAVSFYQTFAALANSGKSNVLESVAVNSELAQCVNQNGLRGKKTIGLLSSADYQLLKIKRPDVRDDQMISTILLQEQSKFSLSIDQVFVDYLECPSMKSDKFLYVVAVAKRTLKDRYQALIDASLQPVKITLPEFIYAHYVKKNYASESTVIWVNYFQDVAHVLAFYQGDLISILKLPKMESSLMPETCVTALNLFYLSEIKSFSASPLWLMNGTFTLEESLINQINGRVQWLKPLGNNSHSAISHAYYGMMANE